MRPSPLSLVLGFDRLGGAAGEHVLGPDDLDPAEPTHGRVDPTAPAHANLDPSLCTAPLLTDYLMANRRRLGLTLRLLGTEQAARSGEQWFYELPIRHPLAETVFLEPSQGFEPLLPPVVRTALHEGRAGLLLTDLVEGFTLGENYFFLRTLYSYLDGVDLPRDRICYCCASANLEELHDRFCAQHGITDRIRVMGVHYWEEQTYLDFDSHDGVYQLQDGRIASPPEFAA